MGEKTLRILIVDDSPEDRESYRRRITRDRSASYQFFETSLGEQGLILARQEKPDCILLDYNLPDLDGLAFLDRLRAQDSEALIPVVMLTGQGSETVAVESLKRGAQDYLVKQLSGNDLSHVVNRVIEHALLQTQRKHAEQELRRSQEEFCAMANSIPQLAWMARPDGWIFWFNQRWHDYCGSTLEQMQGWGWKSVLDPGELGRVVEKWNAAIATAVPWEDTFQLRAKEGEVRWHLSRAMPFHDVAGNVILWFGTHTDITEQRNKAHEREQLLQSERNARAESERAGRMKDEFLATLSHELRTPLNAILGWSQLLRGSLDDRQTLEEGISVIERNARAQVQLIEDLLDMSRISSGKLRLDVQPVDVTPFVDAAIETITPAAEAKGIRLQKSIESGAGPVSGDPGRLQQVMWNILANAIKFTPAGGTVQVTVAKVKSQVQIKVTDTGQGIDPEFLPHVFERFRQADSTTTRVHGGLGLGLAIVKQLVELHGGTVVAASAGAAQGSTFTVSLPIAAERRLTDGEIPPRPRATALSSSNRKLTSLRGLTVLVVDDEPDAQNLIRRVLEECDATVITAGSAADAIRLLARSNPDVLVSDIGMPHVDGYEFLKQVRSLEADHARCMPAIALTAYARSEDRTRALLAGYLVHVAKPVEPQELVATVATIAGRTGPRI
jgi:PAS domain S-box-containing protein